MEKKVISFCIPVYSRCEYAESMIASILKYDGDDIEVVAVDDCSSDNTYERLTKIEDERLILIKNSENLGSAGNFLESLKYGNGEYKFVALARERIHADKISDLISFLSSNNFSLVYCGEDNNDRSNQIIHKPLSKIAYRSAHPTGFVFKSELLNSVITHYDVHRAFSEYLTFPHEYLAAEIISNYPQYEVGLFNKVIRERVCKEYLIKYDSGFEKESGLAWYHPQERLKQFYSYASHCMQLEIPHKEKTNIILNCYVRGIIGSTYEFRLRQNDPVSISHYRQIETPNVNWAKEYNKYARMFTKECNTIIIHYKLKINVLQYFRKNLVFFEVIIKCMITKVRYALTST